MSIAWSQQSLRAGNFKNVGREWQPQGEPDLVDVHDFPDDAVGKAIPYGVYDLAANDGFVNVGVDHDTIERSDFHGDWNYVIHARKRVA